MADIYEAQQAQYQGALGKIGIGGYSSSASSLAGQANSIQPAQQDTLASLIGTVLSLANNLHVNSAAVADSLAGCQPPSDCAKAPSPNSALDILRQITYTLQAATGEVSRAKRALGIQ